MLGGNHLLYIGAETGDGAVDVDIAMGYVLSVSQTTGLHTVSTYSLLWRNHLF